MADREYTVLGWYTARNSIAVTVTARSKREAAQMVRDREIDEDMDYWNTETDRVGDIHVSRVEGPHD